MNSVNGKKGTSARVVTSSFPLYNITYDIYINTHPFVCKLIGAYWRHMAAEIWSILAQVMACCLTAPSHYLNQGWLIIRGVLWHSSENSFAGIAQGINSGYKFEKDILKIIFKSLRGQWVSFTLKIYIHVYIRMQRNIVLLWIHILIVWDITIYEDKALTTFIYNFLFGIWWSIIWISFCRFFLGFFSFF